MRCKLNEMCSFACLDIRVISFKVVFVFGTLIFNAVPLCNLVADIYALQPIPKLYNVFFFCSHSGPNSCNRNSNYLADMPSIYKISCYCVRVMVNV